MKRAWIWLIVLCIAPCLLAASKSTSSKSTSSKSAGSQSRFKSGVKSLNKPTKMGAGALGSKSGHKGPTNKGNFSTKWSKAKKR